MDKLLKWVVIGILCALKLIMTGLLLAMGFRIGAILMAKMEGKCNSNKVQQAATQT